MLGKIIMQRTKVNRKPTAILTSDMHLREDTPTCFTGDFQKEQWVALDVIKLHQLRYGCPVLHAGDLFHHWKPSPWLLSKTMQYLPDRFSTILGQHDLPQHNLDLVEKCGVWTLVESGMVKLLHVCHYGQEPNDPTIRACELTKQKNVLVWHHLTYIQKPFPGASGGMAEGILRKYPQFDLIVTGDNHCSFTVEYKGRRLVNPGNLTRQTAAQIDYQPRVALWYAEDNSIEWINLPMQEGVISREHIERKEERDNRIDAFVNRLDGDWKAEMSFEENLENFFQANNVREPIKDIIYKSLE